MKITIQTPTKAFVEGSIDEMNSLRKQLTYTNTAIQHLIKRHWNQHNWKSRNITSWTAHLDELTKNLKRTLVFEEDGQYYIRPGSIPHLINLTPEVVNLIKYPTPKKIPWDKPLPFVLHPEQDLSWERFLENKHANVSLTTGFGKSAILLKTTREIGLRCVIVVPSKSIFEELLEKFQYHFGHGKIGTFGAGKKKLGKNITIAIGDSLVNIVKGSEEDKFFSGLDMMIVDESHEFAAESLEAVCHGVLASIPYRFFLSATQIRNDGSGPLLNSIIGKTVCELSTAEAVQKGYICPHDFKIVSLPMSDPLESASDPLVEKRIHFLNNRNIGAFSARLANAMATNGQGTLILVSELSQISMIVPMLKVPFAIAHSEKGKDRLLDLKIDKVDNRESVEKFNRGEVKVLIGTSCIATGTNIFPCHNVVNWVGGSSPIRTKQGAVGRAVRFGKSNPWADKCLPKNHATIWDFDIEDNQTLQRHLESRMECYQDSGKDLIKYIRLK